MVDKYTVRFFAQEKVGEDIAVPLYRHGTDPEKIPFGTLPNSFVIKCNHGSKYNIFVYDKKEIDETAIKQQLKTWLAIDFRKISRELQYKWIQKQICIEQLLQDENGVVPYDYKCYCFQWVPKYINVSIDRFTNLCIDFYDTQRNKQSFYCKQISTQQTEKPTQLAKMLDYATKLSAGIPFVRVDFYQLNNKVYLGEMTLTPDAWHWRFYPDHQKIDKMFWDLIHLPHHFN